MAVVSVAPFFSGFSRIAGWPGVINAVFESCRYDFDEMKSPAPLSFVPAFGFVLVGAMALLVIMIVQAGERRRRRRAVAGRVARRAGFVAVLIEGGKRGTAQDHYNQDRDAR